MSVLFNGMAGGSSGVDTGDIGHSLRFRASGSTYMSRTPSNTTNRKTYTISMWVKRGTLGAQRYLISAFNAGTNECAIRFNANDTLEVEQYTSPSYNYQLVTTQVFRDPSAFIHILLAVDTTQATASDRIKLYINGVQVTAFSTASYPSLNYDTNFNLAAYTNQIGAWNTSSYLDGYLSRIAFVDGQALTPSSFGYLNTEINEWVSKSQSAVKAVVDAGGANSFMLDFDDATSLTTLGYDKSSKGNNWTLNNFSLTAGTTYDWMLDVPGNSYATLNPLTPSNAYCITPIDGNLYFYNGPASNQYFGQRGTTIPNYGKWYWESLAGAKDPAGGDWYQCGIMLSAHNWPASNTGFGALGGGYAYYNTGNKNNAGAYTSYGASYTSSDVIGIAFDADAGTLTFYKNGVSQGVAFTGITTSATHSPANECYRSTGYAHSWTLNFGQYPFSTGATYDSAAGGYFRYTPPTGFKALCQANLPTPAILNPKAHFDIKTRTGTAAAYSVTGLGFQPDLLWSKSRGRAVDHALYDSARGVQKQLESNQTGAETTETTGLTSFNSDGYTGGALDQINGTTATNSFVDWLWKAGGAAVSNTAGSITSQVSANVDAGFSIVTYNKANTTNETFGHGLGKELRLVIVKDRGAIPWRIWHQALSSGYYLAFDTAAQANNSGVFTTTVPSSSVVSLGTAWGAGNHVAYCFADIEGYSKAFSYTGNGSADGPYVHLGFKPKWILEKRVDSAGDWVIHDSARSTYNVTTNSLWANLPSAEGTYTEFDFTANGFKLRDATNGLNTNGATYIGFAIADVAGKYSLGR